MMKNGRIFVGFSEPQTAGSGDAQFLILHRVVHQKSKILERNQGKICKM